MVINGQLPGVYALLEKIKVDKNRVDVEEITPADNSGDALTGGYIFKIDKYTGNAGGGWYSSQNVSLQNPRSQLAANNTHTAELSCQLYQ